MATTHKTTEYIVSYFSDANMLMTPKRELCGISFRPTDGYIGRKDSDQYSLALGLKADNLISHDLWLNDEIPGKYVYHTPGGLESYPVMITILAKRTYIWDYSKEPGFNNRASEVKETKSFQRLWNLWNEQMKTSLNRLKK